MKTVKLGDVCFIQGGYAFKSEEFKESGVPLIRISNIIDDSIRQVDSTVFLDQKYLTSCKGFIVKRGDILIALSGATTGKYGIYGSDSPALLNQRVGRIVIKPEKVSPAYIYFYMNQIKDLILKKAYGAAIPNISPKDIAEIEIPLPPLEEQQRIAAVLDKADHLRQLDRQLVAQYDQLTQSVFLEMFGDLRINQRRWPEYSMNELVSRITVGYVGPLVDEYLEDGIPILRSLNIKRNRISMVDIKYINEKFHHSQKKSSLKPGDVVAIRTGNAGVCAVIPSSIVIANCADLIVISCKSSINPYFLAEFFNFKYGDHDTIQGLTGAIQKHFNIGVVKKEKIPTPPIDLQTQFADIIENIERQKAKAEASLQKSEALFQALLQRAFKGELFENTAALKEELSA